MLQLHFTRIKILVLGLALGLALYLGGMSGAAVYADQSPMTTCEPGHPCCQTSRALSVNVTLCEPT
jgi:hypothetical protein